MLRIDIIASVYLHVKTVEDDCQSDYIEAPLYVCVK